MTRTEQRHLLRRVVQTYTKMIDMEAALRLRGEAELAAEVAARTEELRAEVDRLRREMWRAWTGSAGRLDAALRELNADLQGAIRDIARDVRTADRVARALEIVGEVLGLVRAVRIS